MNSMCVAVLYSSLTYLYSVCKLLWLDELKKKNKKIKNDFLPLEDKYLSEEIDVDIENDKPI